MAHPQFREVYELLRAMQSLAQKLVSKRDSEDWLRTVIMVLQWTYASLDWLREMEGRQLVPLRNVQFVDADQDALADLLAAASFVVVVLRK